MNKCLRKRTLWAAPRRRRSAPSDARTLERSGPGKPGLRARSPLGPNGKMASVALLRRELDGARAQQAATASGKEAAS
jgi:hypothetical protein